jgi:hypothetical protein
MTPLSLFSPPFTLLPPPVVSRSSDSCYSTGIIFWEAIRSRCHTRLNFNDLAAYAFNLSGNRSAPPPSSLSLLSLTDPLIPISPRSFLAMFTHGLKRQTLQLIEGQGRSFLGTRASDPLNLGYITTQGLVNTFDPASKILDSASATHLKSSLPLIMEHEKFALVFSTHRDGWNLDTLFKRTLNMSPCIIVIKSLQQNGIVGAYIPVPISPPTDSIRGNGTAFVFRLTRDKCDAFKWLQDYDQSLSSRASGDSEDCRNRSSGSATSQQFAMFTSEFILIGGSALHGTNAIRIDSELKTCSCGPSDTYHNPPLLPEELIQPFIIGQSFTPLPSILPILSSLSLPLPASFPLLIPSLVLGELEIFCPLSSSEREMKSHEYESKSLWKSEKSVTR